MSVPLVRALVSIVLIVMAWDPFISAHDQLYLPLIQTAPNNKGLLASYWETACADLVAVGGKHLIGGHPQAPACLADYPKIEYVPHLDWRDLSRVPVPAEYLLTINEPEGCGPQFFFSCLTPEEALPVMAEIVALYGHSYKLTYPGLLAGHDDLDWLPQFRQLWLAAYGSPPPLAVIVFHCYNTAEVCISRAAYFTDLCAAWEECQEVWITEFGLRIAENFPECLAQWPNWETDLALQVHYYEQHPLITRHYFGTNRMAPSWYQDFACAPVLFEWESGQLTAQGQLYRNLP